MLCSGRALVALSALMAVLLTAGCALPMAPAASSGEMAAGMAADAALPTPQPGVITVDNVRARPAPLEGGNGAAFMLVLNGTDAPVQLQSVSTDVAGVAELHETVDDNGVMRMVPQPDGFEIPAGAVVELKPGGKHVMLLGLVAPLEAGQRFSLTLNFDDGTTLPLTVPVVEMEGMPGMDSMDGHGMEGEGMEGEGTDDADSGN